MLKLFSLPALFRIQPSAFSLCFHPAVGQKLSNLNLAAPPRWIMNANHAPAVPKSEESGSTSRMK
jgi:hypothetical protein